MNSLPVSQYCVCRNIMSLNYACLINWKKQTNKQTKTPYLGQTIHPLVRGHRSLVSVFKSTSSISSFLIEKKDGSIWVHESVWALCTLTVPVHVLIINNILIIISWIILILHLLYQYNIFNHNLEFYCWYYNWSKLNTSGPMHWNSLWSPHASFDLFSYKAMTSVISL